MARGPETYEVVGTLFSASKRASWLATRPHTARPESDDQSGTGGVKHARGSFTLRTCLGAKDLVPGPRECPRWGIDTGRTWLADRRRVADNRRRVAQVDRAVAADLEVRVLRPAFRVARLRRQHLPRATLRRAQQVAHLHRHRGGGRR